MTTGHRKSIIAAGVSRALQAHSPTPAAAQTRSSGTDPLAPSASTSRREKADRRAIERAEGEGMIARPA